MRIVVAVLVWIAALAGAAELSSAVAGSIQHNRTTTTAGASSSGASATAAAAPFDPSSVRASDGRSLLRGSNLARALTTVRHHLGAAPRISTAAVYPGYLSLVVLANGQLTSATVGADGSWHATTAGAAPSSTTFGPAALRPAVITTVLGRIETGAHVALARFGYVAVVAGPTAHQLIYAVYESRQGTSFRASGAHGSIQVVQGSQVRVLR